MICMCISYCFLLEVHVPSCCIVLFYSWNRNAVYVNRDNRDHAFSFQFLIHIQSDGFLLNWSKTKKHLKRIFDDVLRITNRNDCEKYEWKTRLKTDDFLRLSTATNCQTQMCSNCRDLQISPELGVDFI